LNQKSIEDPIEISNKEFLSDLNDFENLDSTSKKEIFNLAWESRKFEIELYWKRAAYFWAFQAVALAGYFGLYTVEYFEEKLHFLFYINCLGIVTSLGWYLINIGSKSWQRHWEKIVDLLEDMVIGKLYKTITMNKTYSVSKINELISLYFTILWLLSLIFRLLENHLSFSDPIDWRILIPLILTVFVVCQMLFGRGRGRFKERQIKLFRRSVISK